MAVLQRFRFQDPGFETFRPYLLRDQQSEYPAVAAASPTPPALTNYYGNLLRLSQYQAVGAKVTDLLVHAVVCKFC